MRRHASARRARAEGVRADSAGEGHGDVAGGPEHDRGRAPGRAGRAIRWGRNNHPPVRATGARGTTGQQRVVAPRAPSDLRRTCAPGGGDVRWTRDDAGPAAAHRPGAPTSGTGLRARATARGASLRIRGTARAGAIGWSRDAAAGAEREQTRQQDHGIPRSVGHGGRTSVFEPHGSGDLGVQGASPGPKKRRIPNSSIWPAAPNKGLVQRCGGVATRRRWQPVTGCRSRRVRSLTVGTATSDSPEVNQRPPPAIAPTRYCAIPSSVTRRTGPRLPDQARRMSLYRFLYRMERIVDASSSIAVKRPAPPTTENHGGHEIMSPTSYQAAPPRNNFKHLRTALSHPIRPLYRLCTGALRGGANVAQSGAGRQAPIGPIGRAPIRRASSGASPTSSCFPFFFLLRRGGGEILPAASM